LRRPASGDHFVTVSVIFKNRLYRVDSGVFSVAGRPVSPDELPEPVRRTLDRDYLHTVLGPQDPQIYGD
jgi:hypothetical protein